MGCGICAATLRGAASSVEVTMVADDKRGHPRPDVKGWKEGLAPGEFLCPGAMMNLPALSQQEFGAQPTDPIVGIVQATRAVQSTNADDLARAASGGAIPAILRHLFASGAIEVAYAVVQVPGQREGVGVRLRETGRIVETHGSFYHPPNFGGELPALLNGSERFAYVGLPCQVAGLRMAMSENPDLRKRAIMVISAFCGGYNTFQGVAWYLKAFGIDGREVAEIRYRDGPWPGAIAVTMKDGTVRRAPRIQGNSRWKIMRYMAAFQGGWMLKRCRICPDQIGDFADISVGDPHLPRFRKQIQEQNGAGWSAMITRTRRGEALIAAMIGTGALLEQSLSRDEVVASQGYTLDNRRQSTTYAKVERWLGGQPPQVTVYEGLQKFRRLRHFINAVLDLAKLRLPKKGPLLVVAPFWQAFEYVFLRFPLLLTGDRLSKMLRNR